MQERLQKIIARAGVASRRRAEQLIVSGLVSVNGRVITELGTRADAERDHIKVAGKLLRGPRKKLYLAWHKPAGVVSSLSDPEGRHSLAEFLRGVSERVYPVGRLEYDAAGLLLLTNDGDFANLLLRAQGVPQTYQVKTRGRLDPAALKELQESAGIRLREVKRGANAWYEVVLVGASRDPLRRKLEALGHPVEKMKRVRIGEMELGGLLPGQLRALSPGEIASLERRARSREPFAHRAASRSPEAGPPRRAGRPVFPAARAKSVRGAAATSGAISGDRSPALPPPCASRKPSNRPTSPREGRGHS